jgi:hypothetical protein
MLRMKSFPTADPIYRGVIAIGHVSCAEAAGSSALKISRCFGDTVARRSKSNCI